MTKLELIKRKILKLYPMEDNNDNRIRYAKRIMLDEVIKIMDKEIKKDLKKQKKI